MSDFLHGIAIVASCDAHLLPFMWLLLLLLLYAGPTLISSGGTCDPFNVWGGSCWVRRASPHNSQNAACRAAA